MGRDVGKQRLQEGKVEVDPENLSSGGWARFCVVLSLPWVGAKVSRALGTLLGVAVASALLGKSFRSTL